jgi:hypothetical protein
MSVISLLRIPYQGFEAKHGTSVLGAAGMAGRCNLGYGAAGGERTARSKELGCNKAAGVFACLNALCWLRFGT